VPPEGAAEPAPSSPSLGKAPEGHSAAPSPDQVASAEAHAPAAQAGEPSGEGVKLDEPPLEADAAKSQQPMVDAAEPAKPDVAADAEPEPPSMTPAPAGQPEGKTHAQSPDSATTAETHAPAAQAGESLAREANAGVSAGEPDAAPSQPSEPAPVAKSEASIAKPEPVEARRADRPKTTVAPQAQAKPKSNPLTLGAGGAASRPPSAPAMARASAGAYAARVRADIGRHKPKAVGVGSATVTFAIGESGGLRSVRISRSSGKAQLDQAALASVRSAAPFPPPPAGLNPGDLSYAIQIFFR